MIKSEEVNGQRCTEIQGAGHEALMDLMHLLSAFVMGYRHQAFTDDVIEKQLVNCIAGGFEIANKLHQGGNDNE